MWAQIWDDLIDIQDVALQGFQYDKVGLRHLVQTFLRFQAPESRASTLSNWRKRKLSSTQIVYATLDALYAGEIHREMTLQHSS
jgi:ribonuclease D